MYSLRNLGIKHMSSPVEDVVAMIDYTRRRSFALPLAVLLGGCSAIDGSGPPTASGRVDQKYITASTKPLDRPGGETDTLVQTDSEGETRTLDGKYDDSINDSTGTVSIPNSLHATFEEQYSVIRYHMQIELSSRDPINNADSGGLGYRTTRNSFNNLSVNTSFKYEISEGGDRISAIVDRN